MEQPSINPEAEQTLAAIGGPLAIDGLHGRYVVMRADVYEAMLGISDSEEAETLASVRRGLADVDAGRTYQVSEALAALRSRYGS